MLLFLGCASKTPINTASENESGGELINIIAPDSVNETLREQIKAEVKDALLPYEGIEYSRINITVAERSNAYELGVIAATELSPYVDAYRFFYNPEKGELLLKGYLLEALPEEIRSRVIAIALRDQEVQQYFYSASFNPGEPTVRRVLPNTAAKFYAPKQLFSVTWADFENKMAVSALVDLEENNVVQRWQGGVGK